MNLPLFLADLLVVVHFLFIVFVVLGGFAALARPRIAWFHIPAAAWGAAIEFGGWICPLTPLEQHLRAAGGAAPWDGSFIQHYLVPVIYPAALTREVQWLLGTAVVVINALIYACLLARCRKSGGRAQADVSVQDQ